MLKFVNKQGTKVMEMADDDSIKVTDGKFAEKLGEMMTRENVSVKDQEKENE